MYKLKDEQCTMEMEVLHQWKISHLKVYCVVQMREDAVVFFFWGGGGDGVVLCDDALPF